jgi:hypothetical protein
MNFVPAPPLRFVRRFTVRDPRDEKQVHNLLWAFAANPMDDFAARNLDRRVGRGCGTAP